MWVRLGWLVCVRVGGGGVSGGGGGGIGDGEGQSRGGDGVGGFVIKPAPILVEYFCW